MPDLGHAEGWKLCACSECHFLLLLHGEILRGRKSCGERRGIRLRSSLETDCGFSIILHKALGSGYFLLGRIRQEFHQFGLLLFDYLFTIVPHKLVESRFREMIENRRFSFAADSHNSFRRGKSLSAHQFECAKDMSTSEAGCFYLFLLCSVIAELPTSHDIHS